MTPFREAAESPTQVALARLDALPVHPLRRMCVWCISYREVPHAASKPNDVAAAEALGFRRLGYAAEGSRVLTGQRAAKQIFVDAARTTQAHLSERSPTLKTSYFLVTYFESGHCIITWDRQPLTKSSARLESRSSEGSFAADYAAHVSVVKARAKTETAIVVEDIGAAVALGRFYYRHVVALTFAVLIGIRLLVFLGFAAVIVIWMVRRSR